MLWNNQGAPVRKPPDLSDMDEKSRVPGFLRERALVALILDRWKRHRPSFYREAKRALVLRENARATARQTIDAVLNELLRLGRRLRWWLKSGINILPVVIAALLGVVLLLAAWLLSYGPGYFLGASAPPANAAPLTWKEFLDLQNAYRATFALILGGIVLVIGAGLTWATLRTTREMQITQRFTEAVRLLGSERDDKSPMIETRLGAIYALERIALDSPRDHWAIMEVLTAYVRMHAPWPPRLPAAAESAEPRSVKPRADIQAVLTVLGRRNLAPEKGLDRRLDLCATDLHGADLSEAHLEQAYLINGHLEGAALSLAHLEGALLVEAHLNGADLTASHLEGAFLHEAHLNGANLTRANLEGAYLRGAHLEEVTFWKTRLMGADVEDATGLTLAQLEGSGIDLTTTTLPQGDSLESTG